MAKNEIRIPLFFTYISDKPTKIAFSRSFCIINGICARLAASIQFHKSDFQSGSGGSFLV